MVQLYQPPKLNYAGSADEQDLAQRVFTIMRAQGFTLAVRTPIRQTLENLAQYMAEQKYKGIESAEELVPLVDQALSANPAIFLREEGEDGQVIFKTTKVGVAPPATPVSYDHHSFRSRLYEGARPVLPPTEEEVAAKQAEAQARAEAAAQVSLPLPFAAEGKTAEAAKAAAPQPAPAVEPTKQPPAQPKPAPVAQQPAPAAAPAQTTPPPAPPKPEVAPEPAKPAATVAPKPAPVVEQPVKQPAPEPAKVAPQPAAPAVPVLVEVADGVEVDLARPSAEVVDGFGDYFASALVNAISDDFRFVNFANDWYLEDLTGRYSKGDFRRIRDYMNEVGGPVSDTAILQDVYNKRTSDHDYEATRFALNYRLLKEKKDFEFVGANDDRIWTAPGMPAIGQTRRKASEIGVDYKFLEDAHLLDPSEIRTDENGRKSWEHTITFYEYENGVLPYDQSAKELFPEPLLEDQKALVLRLEAPQLYYTYTAELRYPTGARGGWIAGLEQFFADNLIPGAKLLLTQGDRSNHFLIEYEMDEEQERRLLFYDERRQKFVYRTIAFACRVDENQILTPERFSKLDNQKRLEENDRKKTDFIVANAFDLVGTKQADHLRATLDELFPLVNIERPFSRAYLHSLLTTGNSAFRPDPNAENTYTYRIGAVKR